MFSLTCKSTDFHSTRFTYGVRAWQWRSRKKLTMPRAFTMSSSSCYPPARMRIVCNWTPDEMNSRSVEVCLFFLALFLRRTWRASAHVTEGFVSWCKLVYCNIPHKAHLTGKYARFNFSLKRRRLFCFTDVYIVWVDTVAKMIKEQN